MLQVPAIFLFIWIGIVFLSSVYMISKRRFTFFKYRFPNLILIQNIMLALVLTALSRPVVLGVPSTTGQAGLDLSFCDFIYYVSYLFALVPILLHPLRTWAFYFNYQSSRAKLLASSADPSLFQPINDMVFFKVDLQWFLLKKKNSELKYAAIFYSILIGLTSFIYLIIRYTTDSWYVSRLTPNPEYCPMLMEIELLAIMGIIGVALNLIMTALISKCRENIKLDVETSAINVGVMIVLTIYLLTLFDSVCEATDCAEFRRVVLIVLSQIYMIGNTIFPIVYYHFQFNAQIADQSALKENLQQVFNNVQLKAQFKEFLVSEFSVENFLFLEAIKKLKKKFEGEVDLNLIRQGIQEVYDSFFKKVLFIYLGCIECVKCISCRF
eukprot:NODE_114_length_19305_cov_0.149849.p5 type:complete len:382 gc:universal NODE_114_length_19305_cov_0.149849:13407-14552(+)